MADPRGRLRKIRQGLSPAEWTRLGGMIAAVIALHVLGWGMLTAAMAALGAIGLAISTLTEHAIGAIAALMILVVTSEVVDNVPQLAVVGPYLPTHWWLSFDSLLRVPVDTSTLLRGLLSFAVYAVLFGSFAWARFTSADVTS